MRRRIASIPSRPGRSRSIKDDIRLHGVPRGDRTDPILSLGDHAQPSWPASRVVSAAVQRVIFCYQDGELVCSLDASSGNKASTRVPAASDGEMVHFPAAPGGACLAPSRGRHRCFEPYSSYNICRVDCLLAGVTLHVELAGAIDTSPSCAGPAAALSRQRRGPQAASGTGE
jgi:hypothetical protein